MPLELRGAKVEAGAPGHAPTGHAIDEPPSLSSVPVKRTALPRRDLIILPLLSLATILLMTATAELIARKVWQEKAKDDCEYHSKLLGDRHRANCVMFMKNIEGPWVRYETNDCGYRGTASCRTKPAGAIRFAIAGTSVAFGLHVPDDEYLGSVASPKLSRLWNRPVEFQNLGDVGPDWSKSDVVFHEIEALKPDAVIYIVVPFDLNRMDYLFTSTPKNFIAPVRTGRSWTWTDLRVAAKESRVMIMTQHYLLRDQSFFLRAFLDYADPFDVSRDPSPPQVEQRFARMDRMVGKLAERMRADGVPCYLIALPNRAESAIISKNVKLPNMDAYIFPRRMEEIARKHGVGYIDTVADLQKMPHAENLFYAVDGHPNGRADSLMAQAMFQYFEHHPRP